MTFTRKSNSRSMNRDSGRGSKGRSDNVKYNIVSQEVVEWEPNNFIEISHKEWNAGKTAKEGSKTEGEFFSITRGYYATGTGDVEEGTPIYTKSITIPTTDTVVDGLLSALDKVVSG